VKEAQRGDAKKGCKLGGGIDGVKKHRLAMKRLPRVGGECKPAERQPPKNFQMVSFKQKYLAGKGEKRNWYNPKHQQVQESITTKLENLIKEENSRKKGKDGLGARSKERGLKNRGTNETMTWREATQTAPFKSPKNPVNNGRLLPRG